MYGNFVQVYVFINTEQRDDAWLKIKKGRPKAALQARMDNNRQCNTDLM